MKHSLVIWGNTGVLGVRKSSFRKVGTLNPLSRAIIHELCSDHGLLSGAGFLCRLIFLLVSDSLSNSIKHPFEICVWQRKVLSKRSLLVLRVNFQPEVAFAVGGFGGAKGF